MQNLEREEEPGNGYSAVAGFSSPRYARGLDSSLICARRGGNSVSHFLPLALPSHREDGDPAEHRDSDCDKKPFEERTQDAVRQPLVQRPSTDTNYRRAHNP